MTVNSCFTSEKISKIRWIHEEYQDANTFVTGSWGSARNNIKVWSIADSNYAKEFSIKCVDKHSTIGDVTGLEVFNKNSLAAVTVEGLLQVFNVDKITDNFSLSRRGGVENLHKFKRGNRAPCNGICVYDDYAATFGEDGRLNILSLADLCILHDIAEADNCSVTTALFANSKEILTGNRMGVIKQFDVRSKNKEALSTFPISGNDERKSVAITNMCCHPTQKHIVISGTEEGSLMVWDLRKIGFPVSCFKAHAQAITEIGFHKTQPSRLFTASEGGEFWQWVQQETSFPLNQSQAFPSESDSNNPWLDSKRTKNQINVTSLITGVRRAINSFDVHGSHLACGGDNEAVYIIATE